MDEARNRWMRRFRRPGGLLCTPSCKEWPGDDHVNPRPASRCKKNKNKKLEYAVRDCLVKMCREIRLDLGPNVQKSDQGDEHIYEIIGLSQCQLWS